MPETHLRAGKSRKDSLLASTLGAIAVAIAGAVFLCLHRTPGPTPPARTAPQINETSSSVDEAQTVLESGEHHLPTVDSEILWESPTPGEPWELNYLAPGAQIICLLRPADIAGHQEGQLVLSCLSQFGWEPLSWLNETVGYDAEHIEQLIVGVYPTLAGKPEFELIIHLIENANLPADDGDTVTDLENGWSIMVPNAGNGRAVLLSTRDRLSEVRENPGSPPLRRELIELLAESDSERMLTILAVSSFVWTDGRELFRGYGSELPTAIREFFPDGVLAMGMSLHVGSDSFFELRATGRTDTAVEIIAESIDERLNRLPTSIARLLGSLSISTYSEAFLNEYPHMLQHLVQNTRCSNIERQTIFRSYLPSYAAHNVLLGAQLILLERNRGEHSPEPTISGPETVDVALDQRIDLAFPQESLDAALELFSQASGIHVVTDGAELERIGVTRNQLLSMDLRDTVARDVLQDILAKANPEGKLAFRASSKPAGRPTVEITTRSALEALPPAE